MSWLIVIALVEKYSGTQNVSWSIILSQAFSGTQNVSSLQKDEAWRVNVRIQGCDLEHGYLCGTMEALNVPMADTPVSTSSIWFFHLTTTRNINNSFVCVCVFSVIWRIVLKTWLMNVKTQWPMSSSLLAFDSNGTFSPFDSRMGERSWVQDPHGACVIY